ncbi:MAG TPA: hypothetical protein VMK32_04425 [Burkholderiaceae bacterium]|nr:hypothetical protein [Burkholderiaceae bacterium]
MSPWRKIVRSKLGTNDRVVAHILDPITGYANREMLVGKDIDPDTVRRLGDDGDVFVVVDYQGGVPTATVCRRDQWLRVRAKQDATHEDADVAVWRKREELQIG